MAMHNVPPGLAELRQRKPLVRAGPLLRMAETKRLVHIADYAEYVASHPADSDAAAFSKLTGVRTTLEVPMLKEEVGAIVIYRKEVRRFDDREIVLIKDFAAQAVIAIENARLLNELRQSLEQQTASSEVLKIISTSQGDLQPVFEAMVDNATRICQASLGTLTLYENGGFRYVALHRAPAAYRDLRAREPFVKPHPAQALGRLASTKKVVHVTDVMAEPEPARVELFRLAGTRTLLIVPMLKDEELLGAIGIYRQEVKPFSEEQINLLKNFAAQAVIAIENARLLNELRQRTTDLTERTVDLTEALEQQTATSEVLQVISGSPGDLQPVFAIMLENIVRVCHASFGAVHRCHGDLFQFVAEHNSPSAYANLIRHSPFRPGPHHYFGPMIASKSVEQFADLAASQGYLDRRPEFVTAVELGGVTEWWLCDTGVQHSSKTA